MQDQAAKSARTRILEAAADLFYREGIRAVGVDAVIAHSGVAKMSLYRNFAGKDELVAAFLDYRDELYWAWWDKVVARHPDDPRAQIRAIFETVGKRTAHPDYRGCPFINTAVEFPDSGHPGRVVALANKLELRAACGRWPRPSAPLIRPCWPTSFCCCWKGTYVSGQTIVSEGVGEKAAAAAANVLVEAAVEVARKAR